MGIGDSGILSVGKDRDETLKRNACADVVDEESALISLYYGDEIYRRRSRKSWR